MESKLLHLFGLPRIIWEGHAHQLPLNTPTSLLFHLAVAAEWVPRSRLAGLYRPDESEEAGLRYVRLQLHRAQQFEWAADLEVERDRVRWLIPTDLAVFRAAVALGDLQAALDTATGPLLAGQQLRGQPEFGNWLELEQAAVQGELRTVTMRRVGELARRARHDDAARLCQQLVDADELDEEAFRLLLESLALAGRRDEARKRYRAYVLFLAEELGMDPEAATASLAERIENGELTDAPAAAPVRVGLPAAATGFIGRRNELIELRGLIFDPTCRLLSIVGIGGSGKTRLALASARELADRFPDGAHFVPLLLASDGESAGQAIGRALGFSGASGTAELSEQLAGSQLLLVLDNCEQVAELAELLQQLLVSAPGVKFLLTSRRRLGLVGEWTYDLSGLSTDAEDEFGSEALDLFVTAARRVAPRLALGPDVLAEAQRIVEAVQGLPLALELAASWVRLMPVSAIRQRLEQDLDLLDSEHADLPARHRRLSAVLERTWSDLDAPLTDALMRFVVFSGGADLGATQAVTRSSLPQLLNLVNQSLLIRDSVDRFHVHPLLARFCLSRREAHEALRLEAEADHTDWFHGLLNSRERGSSDRQLVNDLEPDISNIEDMWFRLVAADDTDRMLPIAGLLFDYYSVQGHGVGVLRRTLELLPPADDAERARLRVKAQLSLSAQLRERGGLAEARTLAGSALDLGVRFGLADLLGSAHRHHGDASQMLGDFDAAEAAYQHAITIFEATDDTRELANCLNSLGSLEATRENFDRSTRYFQRCADLFARLDDELNRAIVLNNLGYLEDVQGRSEAAAGLYEECLEAFQRIGFVRGAAAVQNNLVVLYGTLGRIPEAELAGQASLDLKRDIGDELGRIITLKNLGDLQLRQGKSTAARARYLDALNLAHVLQALPRLIEVLPGFCRALRETGEPDAADRLARAALSHPLLSPSARRSMEQAWPHLGPVEADGDLLASALGPYLAGGGGTRL